MKKQSSTRISTALAQPLEGRGMAVLMATFVFFILAMVVPLSIQNASHEIDPYSNDDPDKIMDGDSTTSTAVPTMLSKNPTSAPPSASTYSILPKLDDDDDVISNSQDKYLSYLRPQSSPDSPKRSPSIMPTWFTVVEQDDSEKPSVMPSVSQTPSSQPSRHPSSTPSDVPSFSPLNTSIIADTIFIPGLLINLEEGLLLSAGLTARILAESGKQVVYEDREPSKAVFHSRPDGGATFPDTRAFNPGGWVYVSNSEMRNQDPPGGAGNGGVGAITFDARGNVLHYDMILSKTTWNCGGGRTPWNTWISCEEAPKGVIWQVDPMGIHAPEKLTMGSTGGSWESFAYNIEDPTNPRFYVTEDAPKGALQRFTPQNFTWDPSQQWKMLHGPGTIDYLLLFPSSSKTGSFTWTKERGDARENAARNYPNSEGIDFHDSKLYFVCKKIKSMFVLDLLTGKYTNQSTTSGLFDGGPDQLVRILENGREEFLFFTEEGGKDAGVHGRDSTGLFFTLLESPVYSDETTGLAFSPDGKHLYVAYQKNGILFDVTRKDGYPFHAKSLNVKYHATL